MTDGRNDFEVADQRYEAAERAYLVALTEGADRSTLAEAAAAVAVAGDAWCKAAYAHYFTLQKEGKGDPEVADQEIFAEQAEALSELWRDISAGYAGTWEPPPMDEWSQR